MKQTENELNIRNIQVYPDFALLTFYFCKKKILYLIPKRIVDQKVYHSQCFMK